MEGVRRDKGMVSSSKYLKIKSASEVASVVYCSVYDVQGSERHLV